MSQHFKGLVITFSEDLREENVKELTNALTQFRHVLSVQPIEMDFQDLMNRDRVRYELESKLWDALKGKK